ncbi:DUF1616 domain-containing protein (plasmid) [Haloferax mediterranei ATCC 33500]|nr:DUF1616 domain-containing protein [Haloferax mediterranei]AHZ24640.1 hypothetical protein BM92_17245 [Haloferax mediterranei ATCC 33500]ELZ97407.1 hypothetical protein C439_18833 [Haloferax mediterranei ATCC 33500]MDX5990297.1 DUF1616 domain-containing protein [Haloferax mediterranei ATCC 33500]QCQ77035.1 DUF1616 domain-containing protein [Haloferax mediterranei ATCC 33500]
MKSSYRRWTLDLLLVVAGAVAALAVILLGVSGSVVRSLFVVPFIVFYPGYALLAAAFPERRSDIESNTMGKDSSLTRPIRHTAGLLYSVRLVLATTSSVAIVSGVGILTNYFGWGFHATITGVGVFVVTILFSALAVARRAMLPEEERSGLPPLRALIGNAKTATSGVRSPLSVQSERSSVSLAVNVLLVVSVVAFLSSVGFAMVETQQPESDFTEVYLVTENGSEYEIGGYPQQLSKGEPTTLTLAIENHEHESKTYTVVTELQRLDRAANEPWVGETVNETQPVANNKTRAGGNNGTLAVANNTRVVEEHELSRVQRSVADNETAYINHDVTPPMSGDSLRLVFFVYEGEPPAEPSRESAYQTVQLVVSVDGGEGDTEPAQPQTNEEASI